MGAMASQITSLTIVYSTVYSGAGQRKHQSSASLGNSPMTSEFPAQMASNAENVAIRWRHHDCQLVTLNGVRGLCQSSTMKIEKVHRAALRVVYNDYTTSYSGLLDMSNRTSLFLARLKSLLVAVFKCIRGLNPEVMTTIFVMDNKPYDTRSGSTISQNRVKTIKYGIQSFAYQGAKCWNRLPANIKEIEDLNEFRRHVSKWNGPVCHCGCCVACTIKEL